jgi:hypothetical protein
MFTSGFVNWVYNGLKIEQASGFHGKNIIVVGIYCENPDRKLKHFLLARTPERLWCACRLGKHEVLKVEGLTLNFEL